MKTSTNFQRRSEYEIVQICLRMARYSDQYLEELAQWSKHALEELRRRDVLNDRRPRIQHFQSDWHASDYKPPNEGGDPDLGYATHSSLNGGIWSP